MPPLRNSIPLTAQGYIGAAQHSILLSSSCQSRMNEANLRLSLYCFGYKIYLKVPFTKVLFRLVDLRHIQASPTPNLEKKGGEKG